MKTASSATVLSNLVVVIWLFWRSPMTLSLDAVYWMNKVHLILEAEEPAVRWISERLMQAEQRRSQAGGKIGHIPDGVLLVPGSGGIWHPIDIEVQISKPSETEVRKVMADASVSGWENYPLRHYVSRKARGVVRATYAQMLSQREALQGEPFLPGATFGNLYHLGDPSSSPYSYGRYHNPTWTHFEQALSSTLYISRGEAKHSTMLKSLSEACRRTCKAHQRVLSGLMSESVGKRTGEAMPLLTASFA